MHRRHCKNTQKILLPLKQKKIKIILHENKLRFFCTSSWDIYHEFLQLTGRDILSNHSTNIFINKTYKTSINTIFLKKIFHAHLNGGYKGWRSPVWGFGRDTGRCCAAYLSLASKHRMHPVVLLWWQRITQHTCGYNIFQPILLSNVVCLVLDVDCDCRPFWNVNRFIAVSDRTLVSFFGIQNDKRYERVLELFSITLQ